MSRSFAKCHARWKTWFVASALLCSGLAACDSVSRCTTGTAQCSCRADQTCNSGLSCVANKCAESTGDAGSSRVPDAADDERGDVADAPSLADGRDGVFGSAVESGDLAADVVVADAAPVRDEVAAADRTTDLVGPLDVQGPDALGEDRPQVLDGSDAPIGTVGDTKPPVTDTGHAADTGNDDAGPPIETSKCATGQVRVHVRDMWSHVVTPTMDIMTESPLGVVLNEYGSVFAAYGARCDSAADAVGTPCTYFSACIPNTITQLQLQPINPSGCSSITTSGILDVSSVNRTREYWIEYTGPSSSLKTDYTAEPKLPVSAGKFHVTTDSGTLVAPACAVGTPPKQYIPKDYIRVHFRWPYTDPVKTGYLGAACGDDQLGWSPPPYPTSLNALAGSCYRQALLEFEDGRCLWYSLVIAKSDLTKNADTWISFEYPDYLADLQTPEITLPTFSAPLRDEYWIVYAGAQSSADAAFDDCSALRYLPRAFSVLSENPGPEYPGCGDSAGSGTTARDGGLGGDASSAQGSTGDGSLADGSSCAYTCAVGSDGCTSSTSIGTCAGAADGCTSYQETSACPSGLVCGYHDSPVCFDASWAAWPMPNSPADVAAGAPNLASLTDNGDGTVTDNVTKLMWQQEAPITNSRFLWAEAVTYCRTLSLGGYRDWRLPSLIEFWSLMDFDRQNPCIDTTFFPGAGSTWFWTSTSRVSSPGGYDTVSLYNGLPGSTADLATSHVDVRCVRR